MYIKKDSTNKKKKKFLFQNYREKKEKGEMLFMTAKLKKLCYLIEQKRVRFLFCIYIYCFFFSFWKTCISSMWKIIFRIRCMIKKKHIIIYTHKVFYNKRKIFIIAS